MGQSIPSLADFRRKVLDDILARSYKDGALGPNVRRDANDLNRFRRELMFVSLLAWEYADPAGPMAGSDRLRRIVLPALERIGACLPRPRLSKESKGPGAFFVLLPFSRALLSLQPHVDAAWLRQRVGEAESLFAAAEKSLERSHDYLNERALELAACLNLHRLTGEQAYLDRTQECLTEMVTRQYACGAQPYHTGLWVWGRRPARVYQLLAASLMLYAGKALGRADAVDYVRRLMDYECLGTTRRGEAFVTCFEGLHKTASLACAGRQWVAAAGLGDERFRGLARRAYEIYTEGVLDDPWGRHENFRHEALTEALELGIRTEPAPAAFQPPAGIHARADISTLFVHEPERDLAATLLTGYSAFAEADAGSVKLYALTPELGDAPTPSTCGTDAIRAYWPKPTEQLACSAEAGRGRLEGWVYTKRECADSKDVAHVHNRRLHVTMTYQKGELLLEFETLTNWQAGPVPSRLLFLLLARPFEQSGRLALGGRDYTTPPADSREPFAAEAPVGPVRFSAPDGSALEIVPEETSALRVIAERPAPGDPRPAPEGSLRLAFDGPNALDRGRFRIRLLPAPARAPAARTATGDVAILRDLAGRLMEVCQDSIQDERRDLWRRHNSLEPTRPLILVMIASNGWKELPESACQCQDPFYRAYENTLRLRLWQHALGDDTIQEPWLAMGATHVLPPAGLWGVEIKNTPSPEARGAWKFDPPLKHPEDLERLVKPRHVIDEAKTAADLGRLQDALGGILPVSLTRAPAWRTWAADISTHLARLRGLETIMYDMMDNPEWLHRLLAFMRDGVLAAQEEAERAGDWQLMDHNNQAMAYCRELADPRANSGPVTRKQLWTFFAAQELTLISPEMHDEFMLQYQLPIMKLYGLSAYGCCEDLTRKIDMLRQVPNLRRIAVTPVANVRRCAEQIRSDYVLSWRPNPTDMVAYGYHPDRVERIIRDGLAACRDNGCMADITLKDIETVEADPTRLQRWVKLVRGVADEFG